MEAISIANLSAEQLVKYWDLQIPAGLHDETDHIDFLIAKINKHGELAIKSATLHALCAGQYLVVLRALLRGRKGAYGSYLDSTALSPSRRTLERWARLAEFVEYKKFRDLVYLEKKQLLNMISLSGEREVGQFLADNGIPCDGTLLNPKDKESRKKFRKLIDEFIDEMEKERYPQGKKASSHVDSQNAAVSDAEATGSSLEMGDNPSSALFDSSDEGYSKPEAILSELRSFQCRLTHFGDWKNILALHMKQLHEFESVLSDLIAEAGEYRSQIIGRIYVKEPI